MFIGVPDGGPGGPVPILRLELKICQKWAFSLFLYHYQNPKILSRSTIYLQARSQTVHFYHILGFSLNNALIYGELNIFFEIKCIHI